jgi:hypothetical protein
MRLSCPICEASLPLWTVELADAIAICNGCNSVFDCTEQLPERLRPQQPRELRLPRGVTIELVQRHRAPVGSPYRHAMADEEIGVLTIRRLWRTYARKLWVQAALAVMCWTLFLGGSWLSREPLENAISAVGILIAVIVTWSLLGDLVNKTSISADGHVVEVRHGPLSLRQTIRLRTRQIAMIRVRRDLGAPDPIAEQPPTFAIAVHMFDKRCIDLIDNLSEPAQAVFIAQRLVCHLGKMVSEGTST